METKKTLKAKQKPHYVDNKKFLRGDDRLQIKV